MLSIHEKNLQKLRDHYDRWLDPPDYNPNELINEYYAEHPEEERPSKEDLLRDEDVYPEYEENHE